jgi:endoplasmic reticulum resident protein 44
MGLLNNEQSFYIWSNDKCIPLVKEITFENAEELTDEGLPFLILFHHIDDHQSISLFEKEVAKQLMHERGKHFPFVFSWKICLFSSEY